MQPFCFFSFNLFYYLYTQYRMEGNVLMKGVMYSRKDYLQKTGKYLYSLFVQGNSIKYTVSSLILFSIFFILFFKIVNVDKQLSYPTDYNTKSIKDNINLGLSSVDVSYIIQVNEIFQSSQEKPEILIIADNRTITDINKEANTLFNKIGIGSEKYNNGLLIYLNNNPNPSIRLEIGYGLEDVINDAKAGRILDDNIKKVSNKPLSEFNNDELRQLLPLIFKDTAALIADKYKIDISNINAKDNTYSGKKKKELKVSYGVNYIDPPFVILFFLTVSLLFILILLSNFAYGLFIISLIVVAGYASYLYENALTMMFLLISYIIPFITSFWFYVFPKTHVDVHKDYISSNPNRSEDNKSSFKSSNNFSLKNLFSSRGNSFFNIDHRFMFVNAVIFTTIYYLLLESFISFGFGNIALNIVAVIVIIVSFFLTLCCEAYVVMIIYSLSLCFMFGAYIPYNHFIFIFFIIFSFINALIGYRVYNEILLMDEKRLTFFIIFEIIIRIVLLIIFSAIGKSVGGRSGGGGATR